MAKVRVIFRLEWDDYREEKTILACFPDTEANLGRIAAVPFYFAHNMTFFEGLMEIRDDYYYRCTKPIDDLELIFKCLMALETYYDHEIEFKAVRRR